VIIGSNMLMTVGLRVPPREKGENP
jgi:hypothetical protein